MMELPRYRISRQQVCCQCSSAKTRCNRGLSGAACARCIKRALPCSFASSRAAFTNADQAISREGKRTETGNLDNTSFSVTGIAGISPAETVSVREEANQRSTNEVWSEDTTPQLDNLLGADGKRPNFSNLDFVCPIDADGISNRWINPYVPTPGQKAKTYDPTVTAFIHRMLKSYAAIAVHARGIPPFVHPLQLDAGDRSSSVRNCLNVVRLFERSAPGDDSSIAFLKLEMDKIYGHRREYSTRAALAAYQAYLIYSLVLYFFAESSTSSILVEPMIQLQELASITAKQGIVCTAEQQHTRPKWEAWITAEAKRRTIYIMYLFDGLLSARDGLPSFLGTELQGLYAPAGQTLWSVDVQQDWERKYNAWLAQWPDGYLTIDELWPAPQDLGDAAIYRRQARVDQWLEDVDKLGTMLYAVTSYIHQI